LRAAGRRRPERRAPSPPPAPLSAGAGLIDPILIGDPARIEAAACELGADVSRFPVAAISDPHAAATKAVAMALAGEADGVMKGAIHSDALLAEVVKKDGGLRTSRCISHVFALDVPTLDAGDTQDVRIVPIATSHRQRTPELDLLGEELGDHLAGRAAGQM
jgi:phosphotransacetylase